MARQRTEDLPKAKLTLESLAATRFLFSYLRPYRGRFIIALSALFISSLAGLSFPALTGALIDAATLPEGSRFGDLNTVTAILFGILVVQAAFSFVRTYFLMEVSERSLADLRQKLFDKLLRLPMAFFHQHRVGELSSRISADVGAIQLTMTTTLSELIRQSVILVGGVALIAYTSVRLTAVILIAVPLLVVLAVIFGRSIRRAGKRMQDLYADLNTVVEETFQGISIVKAFTAEHRESRRYADRLRDVIGVSLTVARARGAFVAFIIFILFGGIVAVIWYGGRMVQDGTLSIGELTSFVLYAVFVGGAMGSFADLYGSLQRAIGASERVRELLTEQEENLGDFGERPGSTRSSSDQRRPWSWPGSGRHARSATLAAIKAEGGKVDEETFVVTDDYGPEDGPMETYAEITARARAAKARAAARVDARGEVRVENVSFAYASRPDAPVLRDVSLTVPAGSNLAIVGASGAGKSTLAGLLMRFYEPTSGGILLDGRPATSYDLTEYRGLIAVVPQDVSLFGGTIADNISYGLPEAIAEQILSAARQANALEFIESFPDGFATIVGERGVQLSGGQRQRVAIARAILKHPTILILDEATSSLDSESEHLVQTAIERLMRGRTTFIIAHRLSTIRSADRIAVLGAGRIVESGTYEELVAAEGSFARLVAMQQRLGVDVLEEGGEN